MVLGPRAFSAKAAINVAGGQTSRSALTATPGAPASMASNSAEEALRPFIFQLPAINGRMASVMAGFPREFSRNFREIFGRYALAELARQFQILCLWRASREWRLFV